MNWRPLLARMRGYARAGLLLWLVVAAGAGAGYARTPARYVATQHLIIALLPPGQITAPERERLDGRAADIARTVASPEFLASRVFATALSQRFSVLQGPHAPASPSPEQAVAALSAVHIGARVTITARDSSPTWARLLAESATQVLAQQVDQLLPQASDATIRIIADPPPPSVTRDAAADAAARALLLTQLALAAVTALLSVLALAWLSARVGDAKASSPTPDRGTAPEGTKD